MTDIMTIGGGIAAVKNFVDLVGKLGDNVFVQARHSGYPCGAGTARRNTSATEQTAPRRQPRRRRHPRHLAPEPGGNMRTLSLLALLAALSACRDAAVPEPPPPSPTLTVTVDRFTTNQHPREWPRGSGNSVMINNSLDDEAGLAGLQIAITDVSDGLERTRRFDASDIAAGVPPYDVPESGTASATVRLTRHGEVVAMGVAEWHLRPEARWEVEILRSPFPQLVDITPGDDFSRAEYGCSWRWCHHIWRFDISEDALNYPGESLWLRLWAFHDCPTDVVCF